MERDGNLGCLPSFPLSPSDADDDRFVVAPPNTEGSRSLSHHRPHNALPPQLRPRLAGSSQVDTLSATDSRMK